MTSEDEERTATLVLYTGVVFMLVGFILTILDMSEGTGFLLVAMFFGLVAIYYRLGRLNKGG
jgi:hypothetical protein